VVRRTSKVFMNLLPGLRDLRAPLVSGYLWLTALWLGLGHAGWLPDKRPPGDSEVARLWDLGGTLGKTVVLAVLTFIAYLIGSFLEINPDGRLAHLLMPLVLFERAKLYSPRLPKGILIILNTRIWSTLPIEERVADQMKARHAASGRRGKVIK
jgi:hypothetical protein